MAGGIVTARHVLQKKVDVFESGQEPDRVWAFSTAAAVSDEVVGSEFMRVDGFIVEEGRIDLVHLDVPEGDYDSVTDG